MSKITSFLSAATLAGVATLAGSAGAASAAPAAPAVSVSSAFAVHAGLAAAAATLPSSTIKGKPAAFSPKTLAIKNGPGGTCSATTASFVVVNGETVTETITYGTKSVALKKNYEEFFCLSGAATGAKGTFGLKGSKSTLVVTVG